MNMDWKNVTDEELTAELVRRGYVVQKADTAGWDRMNTGTSSAKKLEAFLAATSDSYAILQLKPCKENVPYRFVSLDWARKKGHEPKAEDYRTVYISTIKIAPDQKMSWLLETLYERFNIAQPEDYMGRSLSVSDVVLIRRDGVVRCYYVDSIGFQELPEFLRDTQS